MCKFQCKFSCSRHSYVYMTVCDMGPSFIHCIGLPLGKFTTFKRKKAREMKIRGESESKMGESYRKTKTKIEERNRKRETDWLKQTDW